jgi:non-ribosomal peptide synthetase-like protein
LECLHEIFEVQAEHWPDDIAIVHRGNSLTYWEVERRANRLARYLRSCGAKTGEFVGLFLERSDSAIVAILAVLKTGAAYVPLDPSYPEDRIRHIIEESGASLLITQSSLEERVRPFDPALVVLDAPVDEKRVAAQPSDRIPVEETGVSGDDLCYVIYTSGTTGRPKGIMTTHRNVYEFTASFNDVCRLEPSDRIYQGFSLSFDGSVEEIWLAFSNGATLVVGPPEIAQLGDETARCMAENAVTYFSTVPTFLSMLRDDIPSLRTVVVSGEPCPPELVRRWVRPGRRMLNVYGPTETTVNATAWNCSPGAPVSIGRPLRGYDLHVLDEEQRPVRGGEVGELYIGGVGVARGYLGQEELTHRSFVDVHFGAGEDVRRLYRTGDLARKNSKGEFTFHGRIDAQVKVRGYRIELTEIESVLREHPRIEAATVAVVEEGDARELAAHVVPASADTDGLDRSSVLELLRRRLPPYMVPAYLDTIDAIPTLPSGKVDRKRLPEGRTALVRDDRELVEPRTELERRVSRPWGHVFGMHQISVKDDFFLDLGGHSLLVAQLVALLDRDEGIDVSPRDVYDHPTISALATLVESRGETAKHGEGVQAETEPTSRKVFESLGTVRPAMCAVLQAISVFILYGLISVPFLLMSYVFFRITDGGLSVSGGVFRMLGIILIAYPIWVAMTVALKWVVIGRHRAGEWPLWGLQYFRFWLASRLHAMSGIGLVSGTPLMNLYYWLMGARVGHGCIIDTPHCVAFDLVSIGDDSSIGSETQLLGYRIEGGMLRVGRVDIGRRCFVGTHSALGLNTTMGDDARLDDLSLLPDGTDVDAGVSMRGSPATPGDVHVPDVAAGWKHRGGHRRPKVVGAALEPRNYLVFGLLHALVVGILELMLVATLVPGLLIVIPAFSVGGGGWGALSLLVAVPFGIVSSCLMIAGFKALILKRIEPGTYRVESIVFLRKWLVDALMRVSRIYMHALYTTIYLPTWLRLLGARVGRLAEISTVSQVTPDLIDIEDGSFFADGSIIGGRRFFRGRVEIGYNRIGRRSFVGNNAILPVGTSVGQECLIGVLSAPPEGRDATPDGTEWLGSPSFRLPHREKVEGFDESVTYRPTRKLVAQRLAVDAVRVLFPGYVATLGAVFFVGAVVSGMSLLPAWVVWCLAPVLTVMVAGASAVSVIALKHVTMGRFEPVVKPLWSTYVWWNEVVNGAYETIAARALAPFLGTPFFNAYLRQLGCRVGRHAYVGTTLFSEFDLVEIGEHAALNEGVVVQNHLFEDRIMKSSYVKIGDECSLGNMSVILYDTEMERGSSLGPLSLLMKGATIPEGGVRTGIPAGKAAPRRPAPSQSSEAIS